MLMLSFFRKKVPLVKSLEDFVDIHNHLLPGIDDGAATVDEAVAMVQQFSEFGIKQLIATPHIMNDYYPNTPETIGAALESLKKGLTSAGLTDVKISAAAEYMLDQSFLELLEKNTLLCLQGKFVLVEMSYFQPPINLNEILFQLQTRNYKPVLAHPERYSFFHSRSFQKYEELKDRGCFFQINLLSLTGHYGKNIQEIAHELVKRNMIDFIGTDTHQMRHLEKISSIQVTPESLQLLQPILERTAFTFKIS